ncbi:hypothetical protein D3C80_1954380 [compost metagenome]
MKLFDSFSINLNGVLSEVLSSKKGLIKSVLLPLRVLSNFQFPLCIDTNATSTAALPGHFMDLTA